MDRVTEWNLQSLINPALELHTATQVAEIAASGLAPPDGRESAIIAELPAGNYTAIVRGVNETTGVALVEAYDLDPKVP